MGHHASFGSVCSSVHPLQNGLHPRLKGIKKQAKKQYFYTYLYMADLGGESCCPSDLDVLIDELRTRRYRQKSSDSRSPGLKITGGSPVYWNGPCFHEHSIEEVSVLFAV